MCRILSWYKQKHLHHPLVMGCGPGINRTSAYYFWRHLGQSENRNTFSPRMGSVIPDISHTEIRCIQASIARFSLVLITFLYHRKERKRHDWQLRSAHDEARGLYKLGIQYHRSTSWSLPHRHHQCRMAAPVSYKYYLHFCSVGGSDDASAIFILCGSDWASRENITNITTSSTPTSWTMSHREHFYCLTV